MMGMAGIVALEERLVDRDVLDPDDPLAQLVVHDPVHQQHGDTGAAGTAGSW
jgi:hypothetical protein